uniref:Uncharacterized protein n=1 Tax=Asparagus officinalis TaxID=4686 RepID=Q2AA41_ASPOF|nr:hypothetical protein 19.t00005 [Asparagus officinalis]
MLTDESSLPNIGLYRTSVQESEEIKKQVQELLEMGVIVPSCSPCGSSVLLVLKKDGGWLMCMDYRALNKITIKDRYPLPRIDDLIDQLEGARFFTKLDLKSGYHQDGQLKLNGKKCEFRKDELVYLGFIVGKGQRRIDPGKVAVITKWPTPKIVTEVRSFMGPCQYLRKFIRYFLTYAAPLHGLTKAKVQFEWGRTHEEAFQLLKRKISEAPVLALPNLQQTFEVKTDASSYTMGAVLIQDGKPVEYHFEMFSGGGCALGSQAIGVFTCLDEATACTSHEVDVLFDGFQHHYQVQEGGDEQVGRYVISSAGKGFIGGDTHSALSSVGVCTAVRIQ